MRKAQRRQSRPVHDRSDRYSAINVCQNGDNGDPQLSHLEKALEIGLSDTFPASDAVAVVQPGRADVISVVSERDAS